MNPTSAHLKFLGKVCIFSIFLDKAIRGELTFDLYYTYPVFLLFIIVLVLEKNTIALPPKWFLKSMFAIMVCSLLILVSNGNLGFEFWKQVFGIFFTSIVYYNVLLLFDFKIRMIFNEYLKFAFWVASFGVIDNLLHMIGIHIGTIHPTGPFQYREYSIMGEPFYLALALTPAVTYYSVYFKKYWNENRLRIVSIFLCYLLTYSSIAVAGFVISVIISLYLNDFFNVNKNKLVLVPVLLVPLVMGVNFIVNNVSLINARFTDTSQLFLSSGLKTQEAGTSNASTFALYSNYIIARDSFLKEPLFGSGLGSHPLIYRETFLKYFPKAYIDRYGQQNQQDANSKFLRLMSETGLVGLALFLFAFFKFLAPKRKMTTTVLKEIGTINYSIFTYILLCLIRNGNYINVGFFLFFFIYYISWKVIQLESKH